MRIKTKSCDSTNHLIGSSAQKSQNGGERDAWRFTRTRLLRFFIFFFFFKFLTWMETEPVMSQVVA